jgi:hypothetical protein
MAAMSEPLSAAASGTVPDPSTAPPLYVVVLPVKPPHRGKSRLVGVPDEARVDLAAAFALDTVTACLATPRVEAVLVATDDARFSSPTAPGATSTAPCARPRPRPGAAGRTCGR